MKMQRCIQASAILLLFGAVNPLPAYQDHHDKGERQDRESHHGDNNPKDSKPAERHESGRVDRRDVQHQGAGRVDRQDVRHQGTGRVDRRDVQHEEPRDRPLPIPNSSTARPSRIVGRQENHQDQSQVWQQHRAQNWRSEHHDWPQRGGYGGYRIPENRYQGRFGSGHPFFIRDHPLTMYGGYPRFQFGGFWFSILDPWPEYWSASWYDSDDVYIYDPGDGYYLCNRRYPQDRIAITVSLN